VPPVAQPGNSPRPTTAGSDWTVQAADTIERVVVGVRDKTTVPLTTVARAVVYGLLAAIMAMLIGVFFAIVTIRIITVYAFPGRVWASYLSVGGIFVVLGALLLRKASSGKRSKGTGKA